MASDYFVKGDAEAADIARRCGDRVQEEFPYEFMRAAELKLVQDQMAGECVMNAAERAAAGDLSPDRFEAAGSRIAEGIVRKLFNTCWTRTAQALTEVDPENCRDLKFTRFIAMQHSQASVYADSPQMRCSGESDGTFQYDGWTWHAENTPLWLVTSGGGGLHADARGAIVPGTVGPQMVCHLDASTRVGTPPDFRGYATWSVGVLCDLHTMQVLLYERAKPRGRRQGKITVGYIEQSMESEAEYMAAAALLAGALRWAIQQTRKRPAQLALAPGAGAGAGSLGKDDVKVDEDDGAGRGAAAAGGASRGKDTEKGKRKGKGKRSGVVTRGSGGRAGKGKAMRRSSSGATAKHTGASAGGAHADDAAPDDPTVPPPWSMEYWKPVLIAEAQQRALRTTKGGSPR